MNVKVLSAVALLSVVTGTVVRAKTDKSRKKSSQDRPNVVFIYGDDMGRGMLSHFGQTYFETPNIDRVFNQGTSFEYAYGCMYSAPSRASLLTGYNDCRKGLWNIPNGGGTLNIHDDAGLAQAEKKTDQTRVELPAGDMYLSQVFKQAGYVTGQIGKLEWGFLATRKQMKEHGWDYFCGYTDHRLAHAYYPRHLVENDGLVFLEGNTLEDHGRAFESESPENYAKRWNMEGKKTYSPDFFIGRIRKFIGENKDKPFFLYLPSTLPHGPVAINKVHPSVKDNPELSELEKEYASMVLKLDETVGVVFEELEKYGLSDNTLVIFSNDNGHETYYTVGNRCCKRPVCDTEGRRFDDWDYPYNSKATGDLFDGNDGMSGKKWMNWEGSVRVPLAFMMPGKIREGYISNQVVANYDLFTTFADMLDVELTTHKDGVSLKPILFGKKKALKEDRYVFVNAPEGPAVIDSDHWKLRYNKKRKEYRLHYLPEDYTESKILNDAHPEKLEQLKAVLSEYIN